MIRSCHGVSWLLICAAICTHAREAQGSDTKATSSTPGAEPISIRGVAPSRSASEATVHADVLRAAPHRNAGDLLMTAPGMFVSQHGGEGKAQQLFLRGFDAMHGQDIELRVAGIPINEVSNIHGQGYADLHFLIPEVVRSIRVLPGPYDPRQGDFAVAGSVEFSLGLDEEGALLRAGTGSFGTHRALLAYRPRGAHPDTFGAFEATTSDGYGASRAAKRASGLAQYVLPLRDTVSLRLLAGAYAGRFGSAGVRRLQDVEAGRIDPLGTYDSGQGGTSSRAFFGGELLVERGVERWSLASFAMWRSLALRQNFTGYVADPIYGDSTEQGEDRLTVGLDASHKRPLVLFGPHDSLEIGLFARHDRVEQSQRRLAAGNAQADVQLVDAQVTATDVGGYADVSIRPIERLRIRAGVRLDGLLFSTLDRAEPTHARRRTAEGLHVGSKSTVDVAITEHLRVLGSFGEGFRSPQARSLVDGQTTPFTTVRSGELGVRFHDRRALVGSAAAFATWVSEDLTFDHVTGRNEATPGTFRRGLAIELAYRPRPFAVLSASATYAVATFRETRGTYHEGDALPYAPRVVSRVDLSLTPKLAHLWGRDLVGKLGLGGTFVLDRPLPYGETGHDIFQLDGTLGLRLKEAELSVDVQNALGTRWYDGEFVYASQFVRGEPTSLVPARHVTVGTPRAAMVQLTLHL